MMRLIGSQASPYVRKVRVVLAEKKLDYQFELESVWADDCRLSELNPLGKVPCLVADDKQVIYDSRVIVEYLDGCSTDGRLIPTDRSEHLRVKIWEALADGLMDASILARLEQTWAGRSPAQRCPAWVERQMKKVHDGLAEMSRQLGSSTWCAGGQDMTLADVAAACLLAYLDFRFPELDWRAKHANLARLLDERLSPRPSFVATQPQ